VEIRMVVAVELDDGDDLDLDAVEQDARHGVSRYGDITSFEISHDGEEDDEDDD
jgi:hypothetical protein